MSTFSSTVTLSWQLFRGTIGAKYRRSFLGYFWMIFPALAITGGVSLASQSGVIRPGEMQLPYPIFVLVGLLVWQVFVESVDVSHRAFDGARSYLTKVNCPREAIILAQLYETLIIAGVRFTLLLALVALFGGGGWKAPGVIGLCFGGAVVLGFGVGALLMPFTILSSDVHHAVKVMLTYGVFITPAFYVPDESGMFAHVVLYSPIAPLMAAARDAAAGIALTQPGFLAGVLGLSLGILVAGIIMVRLSAPIVIERMLVGGR